MIVGTAGHVDHGKTSLVRALTGVDTDRLAQEKARGITIELGFAYWSPPGGASIGFVDMPGHERLVRTMVSGAAGIDFALLAIAADDGIMPQTREHIDILGLLGLERGLVVITKADRVDDARRAAVAAEIAGALAGTSLAGAETVFASARTGEGVETVRAHLTSAAAEAAPRRRGGSFRLPIDRAFTLSGVGTVATGTALQGCIRVGDEVVVGRAMRRARVRSLHAQSHEVEEAGAGDRVALALAGLARDVAPRGAWICAVDGGSGTLRFDADVTLLPGEDRALRDGATVHFHAGTDDGLARIVLLQGNALAPGASAPAQILLAAPQPLRHGDRFVLRDAGARRTIGGGTVIDPRAPVRRRRSPERLARLVALRPRDAADALARCLALAPGLEDLDAFAADRGLTASEAAELADKADLVVMSTRDATFVATTAGLASLRTAALASLADFHAQNPELPGLAAERLRIALALERRAFVALRETLLGEKALVAKGHWLHLPGHVAELGVEDRRLAAAIRPLIAAERFKPPRVRDIGKAIEKGETEVRRTCKALARTGDLVEVAHDHFFQRATVAEMAGIANGLSEGGRVFGAAEFRDRLDNGRKVAIQILEYFDRHGLTRRDGDLRRVVKAPESVFGELPAL